MTRPENSPESPVTTNQRGIPKQPIRFSRAFWVALSQTWPNSSGIFHVDAAALDLEFQFIRLIENINVSAPSWLLYIVSPQYWPQGWKSSEIWVRHLWKAGIQGWGEFAWIVSFTVLCRSTLQRVSSDSVTYKALIIFYVSFKSVLLAFLLRWLGLALRCGWLSDRAVKEHYIKSKTPGYDFL